MSTCLPPRPPCLFTTSDVLLLLLKLSEAFDTVENPMLIERQESWVCLNGVAVDWFCSYLANRSFSAHTNYRSSFLLPSFLQFIYSHWVNYQMCMDDSQIFPSINSQDSNCSFSDCLSVGRNLPASNFLLLSDAKTEVTFFTSKNNVAGIPDL